MASKITIKRSQTAATPAGLSYGEMAFVQGSGLTANQLYMGISGGSPVWIGAQIGTTGTWTDTSAQTSLATQYATDQRIISSSVSSFNGFTGGITFAVGTGITFTASAGTITLSTTGGGAGATGATGPTGPQGVTGAISFTSSTTAPAGATYGDMWFNTTSGNIFVYITDGTSSYWVEPFGPQGATGANGTSGTNGATGATGSNGTNGATGATGATGSQGVTGATGPVGDYVISVNGLTGAVQYIVDFKRGWFLS